MTILQTGAFVAARGRDIMIIRGIFAFLCAVFVCATAMIVATQAEAGTDPVAERVLACASCHGAQGQGTDDQYFPRLAGKPAGYLYHQLVAFRDKRRKYPPMNYLLEFQPDESLRQMADYFASQHPPLSVVCSSNCQQRSSRPRPCAGYAGRSTERGIPACERCHGPSFTGMEPAIPGLLGLRARYIAAQLGAWRYGTRTAAAPDCMQIVAGHLTEADVTAVAAWLSSLPAPANAPSGAPGPALRCR